MSTEAVPQLTYAALKKLTPQQVIEAKRAGNLEAIRRGEPGDTDDLGNRPAQLSRADLAGMSPSQIVKARREGRLADLLAGVEPAPVYE